MSTQITGPVQIAGQQVLSSTSIQMHNLGELGFSNDGRAFKYVKNGAVAMVQGKLYQAPAEVTNHQNLTPVAAAIGATEITTTLGATAAAANLYAGGLLVVTVTPGEGYAYKIRSHAAIGSGGTGTFVLEDALLVALTTSSRIDLVQNPCSGLIVNPTTASSAPVGAAVYPIAIGEYGWLQVKGQASLLADGAITVGTNVIASNATAGAVEAGADAADLQANVGVALSGIATTEYGPIMLNLI